MEFQGIEIAERCSTCSADACRRRCWRALRWLPVLLAVRPPATRPTLVRKFL